MSIAPPPILMPSPVPLKRLFTVREFEQMVESGILNGRYELAEGEIIEMPADGNAHAVAAMDLFEALRPGWPHPKFIRVQSTQRITEHWAPAPDLVLLEHRPVRGALIDELPALVIEVSDETLRYDLGFKRLAYARAGVPEYWIADLKRRRLLVFRGPDRAAVEAEHAYRDELVAQADQTISPLAIPSLQIRVADVLPAAGV